MNSVHQIITTAPLLSPYEQERRAGRLAAIERTKAAARGIVDDLERSFGVHALEVQIHALSVMDAADSLAKREAR